MGASSFTPLSTPNPPQFLGSASRNPGLLPVHLCQMRRSALPPMATRKRRLVSLVSCEDSGHLPRASGSHTQSLFLWLEKYLPKDSVSIKSVWLVCPQQHTGSSGHLQESTRHWSWRRSVPALWMDVWRQRAWAPLSSHVGAFG